LCALRGRNARPARLGGPRLFASLAHFGERALGCDGHRVVEVRRVTPEEALAGRARFLSPDPVIDEKRRGELARLRLGLHGSNLLLGRRVRKRSARSPTSTFLFAAAGLRPDGPTWRARFERRMKTD